MKATVSATVDRAGSATTRRRASTAVALVFSVPALVGLGTGPEGPAGTPSDLPSGLSDSSLASVLSGTPSGTPDDPVELSWRALAGLDFRTGEMSDQLRELAGKTVRIPGFTVPLEDFASSATEFLLVPYVGACVHTPPPPPNQLVYVEMDEGKRAKMDGWKSGLARGRAAHRGRGEHLRREQLQGRGDLGQTLRVSSKSSECSSRMVGVEEPTC